MMHDQLNLTRRLVLPGWAPWFALIGLPMAANTTFAETARYEVTFDTSWSASTHPQDFPSGAHFSGLIGGTHNDSVTFWEPGGMASPGIRSMAETGSKSALNREVETAIDDGSAFAPVSGRGVPLVPGNSVVEFEVDSDFSLLTLVSMIAPSPDWFVGVGGFDLQPEGEWLAKSIVELLPYDAGTDSGSTFQSPNSVTTPQVPIFHIDESPFANAPPLGTFTVLRLLPGDVDRTGTRDAGDIDLLSTAIRDGTTDLKYDLDGNGLIDDGDRIVWVRDLEQTYFGDSNLDKLFDSTDLVSVFQAGGYEDTVLANSDWRTGDWNGDREFTSSDLVLAFQGGGYEQGRLVATRSVPEPNAVLAVGFVAGILIRQRIRGRRR